MKMVECDHLFSRERRVGVCPSCRDVGDPEFADANQQEVIDDQILPREDSLSGWYHLHRKTVRGAVWCEANFLTEAIPDPIHPKHYQGDYVMRVIEDFSLDFLSGQVVKYMLRAGNKPGDSDLQDCRKALWYLNRKIQNLEKEKV